jgi:hypothetical protein
MGTYLLKLVLLSATLARGETNNQEFLSVFPYVHHCPQPLGHIMVLVIIA